MSELSDIAYIIESTTKWKQGKHLFIARQPDEPHFSITLFNIGGPAPDPAYTRDDIDFQILVRGEPKKYEDAWKVAKDLKDLLLGRDTYELGTLQYFRWIMRSNIIDLGYDDKERPIFSLNFRVTVDGYHTGNRLDMT